MDKEAILAKLTGMASELTESCYTSEELKQLYERKDLVMASFSEEFDNTIKDRACEFLMGNKTVEEIIKAL